MIDKISTWSFYDPATGLFSGHAFTGHASMLEVNTPADHYKALEGLHDPLSKKVDVASGAVVDYRPSQPSPDHEWDGAAKRWQLTPAAQARIDADRAARVEIATLESRQLRALRELALNPQSADTRQRLADTDAKIAALRPHIIG